MHAHPLSRTLLALATLASIPAAALPAPAASVVHVAPGGSDRNPGTAAEPTATLARAYERVKDSPQPCQIVLHEGVYVGGVQLGRGDDRLGGPRPHILIRAATRPDGTFERVVFDGARKIGAAAAVPGTPSVFRITKPDKYSPGRPPQMWESDTRKRYTLAADLAAVGHYPASYWLGEQEVFFHTSDGRPPQDHEVGLSWQANGISLWRTDMTLRGIEFRNCLSWSYSCGAGLFAARTAIEDCRAWNTVRGFYSWMGATEGRIVRCQAEDVATGVFCQGIGTRVEDCRLFKRRDHFLAPCYSQDDCGIHYYSPAEDGEIRGNLIVGFGGGIFLKCASQKFHVERNTCVDYTWAGLGSTSYHPEAVYRLNICVGPGTPLLMIDGLKPTTVMDYNLVWGYKNRFMPQNLRKSFAKTGAGAHTIFADPRFAAPSLGDYRLLPGSPAVAKGPAGETLGALPVAGQDFQDREPPAVAVVLEKPARQEPNSDNLWAPEDAWLGNASVLVGPQKLRQPEWVSPGRAITLAIEGAENVSQPRQMRVQIGNGCWGPGEPFQTLRKLTLPEPWQFGPVRVKVCECRVWNKDSPGWVNGAGLVARRSPGFVAARNVIHTVETGMFLLDSPRSRLTHNTVLWNMYGAAYFLRSAAGSVCRNNCFAFSGNQMMRIGTAADDELSRFDCDYNNQGTRLRDPSPPHSLQPEDPLLRVNSKTMVEMNGVYFSSLEEWRKAGGKDRHSIFADPKFISPAAREFRLRPDSPNRGAGENGTTIGALDAVTPSPPANGASRGRNATLANGPREILSGSIHATAPRSSWEGPE